MINLKLILFTAFMLFQQSAFFSQLSGLEWTKDQGYWSVASRFGSAFQMSDVDSRLNGFGTDISISRNLFYREFAWLSMDLRSHLFFGVSTGLDGEANYNIANHDILNGNEGPDYYNDPGFVYNNYHNTLADLGLEINLLLNKYRAEQGWYASLAGGGSLGMFITRMNLADGQNDYAASYAAIDQNSSPGAIKKELKGILDDTYEHKAYTGSIFKLGLMPLAGIEFGYDVNRFLTVFAGHRTIFSRTDKLDGFHLGNPDMDLLNFSHLGLQVYFMKKRPKSRISFNDQKYSGDMSSGPRSLEEEYPRVSIVDPEVDWFNTSSPEIEVRAELENVFSILDISCMVNGSEVPFDYNKDEVRFYAQLQRGTNVLKVQVRNEMGEARDIKRVIYSPVNQNAQDVEELDTPVIELISPESEEYYAEEDIFTIQAILENVESKDDIKLTANGMELNTFRYDATTGSLSLKVRLAKGKNAFILSCFNTFGKTVQAFDVFFGVEPEPEDKIIIGDPPIKENQDPEPIDNNTKPYISIIEPAENPFYTQREMVRLQAELHGISSKEEISFTINGLENIFYDFDPYNKILTEDIQLLGPETEVILQTGNTYGNTRKTLHIIYGEKPAEHDTETSKAKPFIEFSNIEPPDEQCLTNISAMIAEKVQKEDIRLTINDFEVRNFRYVREQGEIMCTLYLDEGLNVIKLEVLLPERTEHARLSLYCGEEQDTDNEDDTPVIDTSPPAILSVNPAHEYVTEEQDIIVRIRTAHVQEPEDIMVFLNDEIMEEVEFDPYKSEAQVMLSLLPKTNIITVRLSNDFGEDERELFYFYDEPFRTVPSVLINSPRNGFSTDEPQQVFRASVDFIKSIDDVTVFLNDEMVTDFTYNEEYGKIQGIFNLRLGTNTLEVKARNRLGESSEKVSFKYKMEHVPAVEITAPKEGLEYRKSFAMLYGIVQNMEDKRGIGIQINRKPFASLNYDKQNELVTARLLLTKGNNEVVLSAKNEYGFASDTINLFFKGAPEKPVIRFIHPAASGERSGMKMYNLEAEILEINHSSQAELTVNGQLIDEIYYYRDENKLRAEVPLKKGYNQIVIVAINETGSTTEKTGIYLD